MELVEYFLKEYNKLKREVPRNFNKQDWEEALQDTYLRLLNVKEIVSFKRAYIDRAIRSQVSHLVSKRRTIGSRLDEVKVHIENGEEAKTPEQLLIDIDNDIHRAGSIYKLTLLINELPDKQRMVLSKVMSGLTVTEVGKKYNLNSNSTKHNYLVGTKKLKHKMGAAW